MAFVLTLQGTEAANERQCGLSFLVKANRQISCLRPRLALGRHNSHCGFSTVSLLYPRAWASTRTVRYPPTDFGVVGL